MWSTPGLVCLIGLLAIGFDWWGVSTEAGRQQFDEMAGIIPMGAGALGALMLLVGLIWLVVRHKS